MFTGASAEAAIARNARAYDALAATYDAAHPEIFNPIEQARLADAVRGVLARCTPATGPLHVLDVGAGTGNLTAHFLMAGARVTSADVSAGCLRATSQRFAATGRHATRQIDGRSLDVFGDGAFDVAACYSVLHHVPDYLALVGEMARVVRPGGLVYIDHERHDASWTDPDRARFMAEAWVFPPKHWSRFIKPGNYWKHIRPLLEWRRWFDPRWMPEGDLHIWPDDHIEWARVEASARAHGIVETHVCDYLLYDANLDLATWERWRHRVTDYRMWLGRKA